jgi:peptide/nickel transport system permease protein
VIVGRESRHEIAARDPSGAFATRAHSSPPSGLFRDALRRLAQNRGAIAGGAVLAALVALAVFADVILPYDPAQIIAGDRLRPPELAHPFGTDAFGRDILVRIVHGSRISLQMGIISVAIGAGLGVTVGLVSGYYSGWTDRIIMRGIDVMLAFPGILLALSVVAILGPDLNNAMIAVGLAAMPHYTRVVRGSVLAARELQYVEAARVVGCRDRSVMFSHILPNVLAPVIVLATLGVAGAILAGAALSFLGLGAKPPSPEWGAMLSEGRAYLRSAPWITTFPGAAIMVTVLAINLLGDGLRDALDPRMRR